MSDNPYRISYRDLDTDEVGSTTLYARSDSEARQVFWRDNHASLCVTDCELDVEQGELDIAMMVAYRAKERHPNNVSAATHEVHDILNRCRIDYVKYRDRIVAKGLPC